MDKKYIIFGLSELIIIILIILLFLFFKTTGKYDVIFADNGKIIEKIKVRKNGIIKVPKGINKKGYEIEAYYVGDKEYNINASVSKSIVIEVKYKKIETKKEDKKENNNKETDKTKTYTVTFDTDGGSAIDSIKVKEGKKVSAPTNPTKEGYEFVEWQLDGTKYDFNKAIKADIALIAVWKESAQQEQPTTPDQPTPQPTPVPQPTPQPDPTPAPVVKNYTFSVGSVDAYTPDVYVTVYENGSPVAISGLYYTDGGLIESAINGTSATVSRVDIDGEGAIRVVLSNGSTVTATRG